MTEATRSFPHPIEESTASFPISLHKTPQDWSESLASAGFNSLEVRDGCLHATKVESFHLDGAVRHSIRLKIAKDSILIAHTLDESQNPSIRTLHSASLAMHALACIGAQVSLSCEFYKYFHSVLCGALDTLSPSQSELEHQNSKLKSEIRQLREKLTILHSQLEKDARRASSDSQKIALLEQKVTQFLKIPDSALDELVLNWLISHDGEISVHAFCNEHSVAPARVESSLERLSRDSKILGV